ILLGKLNMHQFAYGPTGENPDYGHMHNPWDPEKVTGGSSGGSGSAAAAGQCTITTGSDTGGSVRQPAALCGVTGFKPTYGRVPRYGLIASASSLDCVGAIARTAEDLALWLDCASGRDDADATSLPTPPPVLGELSARADLRGLRVGVPTDLNGEGIDDEVLAATGAAIERLRELGATVVEAALPSARHAVSAYYLLATSEAASNLARYDGVHYGWRRGEARTQAEMTTDTRSSGFGEEVQLRILLGTFATSIGYSDQFYEKAQLARRAVRRDFARAFADCDVLVCPTSPTPAPRFGEAADDPLQRYLWDALTVPASLAGIPALSMPCGATADGRPIGLQAMAAHGDDARVLQLAHVFQQHTEHHLRRPNA
ncbi:MAG: aspartyl/glutamyl-tRNA amidotransferase subunit A, partial [Planctomycetes bacterium]|nr:aspartyl/glutamyl-tRNA amidotransferase subunit A [Planctomycetota bacterium]